MPATYNPRSAARIRKGQIWAMREQLGRWATMGAVAEALGISPVTLRRKLTPQDQHSWATDVRLHRSVSAKERAIQRIRIMAHRLGHTPSARESRIHSTVQTAHGGYNALVRSAGLEPRSRERPMQPR